MEIGQEGLRIVAFASGKDQGKVMTVLKAGQSTSNESKLAVEGVELGVEGSKEVVSGHRQIKDHLDSRMGMMRWKQSRENASHA